MTQMLGTMAAGTSSLPKAATTRSSSSTPCKVQPNLRGLFVGDWATDEKIKFLAETFTIFSSLQKIAADEAIRQRTATLQSRSSIASLLPSTQALQYYRRISGLYRDALKRYIQILESANVGIEGAEEEADLELSQWLHTIWHFVETIYVPADGRGAGVVGEEILHWLNSFDFGEFEADAQSCQSTHVGLSPL